MMKSHEIDAQPLPTAVNPTKRSSKKGDLCEMELGAALDPLRVAFAWEPD
jgi:hypothetical protein